MKQRIHIFLAVCLVFISIQSASAGRVQIKVEDHKANVTIDGEAFTTYHFSPKLMKPYFHPLYAPGKKLVVRKEIFNKEGQGKGHNKGLDHFHHKGLWIAIDSINKEMLNYWHEANRMTAENVTVTTCGDNATLHVINAWLDNDDKPILKNKVDFTFTPDRMIICEMTLVAQDQPVTFGDTKEGLFAIRLNYEMRGLSGGRIINADGLKGEKECWGKPTAWIDYHGEVGGDTVGVALFDDPNNFRPSRYHVRGYGLFSINPFGEKKYSNGKKKADPVTLKPGESLKLRYAAYIHQGDEKQGKVVEHYKQFLSARKK